MPVVKVSLPIKRRLDTLQAEAVERLGRQVTLAEIVEALLGEHDRSVREEAGA